MDSWAAKVLDRSADRNHTDARASQRRSELEEKVKLYCAELSRKAEIAIEDLEQARPGRSIWFHRKADGFRIEIRNRVPRAIVTVRDGPTHIEFSVALDRPEISGSRQFGTIVLTLDESGNLEAIGKLKRSEIRLCSLDEALDFMLREVIG
jgi:hypothetical protein